MKVMRELLIGMLTAIASIFVVMGGITLSVAQEQPVQLSPTVFLPTNTLSPSPTSTAIASPTLTPTVTLVATASLTPAPTSTVTELIPTTCPPPTGWQKYVVTSGTNLDKLARARGITVDRLLKANCLVIQDLVPDILLYVPPLKSSRKPTQTKRPATDTPVPTLVIMKVTPVPCGQPHGWVVYYAQSGDTLNHLGMTFNTTALELQQANCLEDSTFISTGQRLYVPILLTGTSTDLPTQTPLQVPTHTFPPTYTPTFIPTNTFTFTPAT